eukprot:CAMPEP_0183356836 /NCGR_PEP_ID=MMETSP0164_2-20130417/45223_1 /TAXON_ID=221442 /ORGANISM="Coccolithus pelagicus ssp braarudi, Strain PLY182g" /LENGTH=160 /DNA_ID=CAMNT_0025530339 /DNA_START=9 /DNA_END=491 /DNA_ORIENTATION=+
MDRAGGEQPEEEGEDAAEQYPDVLQPSQRYGAMATLLRQFNLEEYAQLFVDQGYDDPKDLAQMDELELRDLASQVGMKPGHASRFVRRVSQDTGSADVTYLRSASRSRSSSFLDHLFSRSRAESFTPGRPYQQQEVQVAVPGLGDGEAQYEDLENVRDCL